MSIISSTVQVIPLWFIIWLATNSFLSVANKAVMHWTHCSCSLLISAVHMILCYIISAFVLKGHQNDKTAASVNSGDSVDEMERGDRELSPSSSTEQQQQQQHSMSLPPVLQGVRLWMFSLLFCLNIAFGNLALLIVNLAMSQVFRSITPLVVIVLNALIAMAMKTTTRADSSSSSSKGNESQTIGTWPSRGVTLSVLVLVSGVAMSVLTNVDFSPLNIFVLSIGVVLAALKTIITNRYLTKHQVHPVVLMHAVALPSAFMLIVLSLLTGEMQNVYLTWSAAHLSNSTLVLRVLALGSTGILAFVLNHSNFMANKATSALTMTIGGNIKQVLSIMAALAFEHNPISLVNITGLIVFFIGFFAYSWIRYQEQQLPKKQQRDRKHDYSLVDVNLSIVANRNTSGE